MTFTGVRHPTDALTSFVYVDVKGEKGRRLRLPRLSRKHEARHSPTGFEWGYAGSGPAELARAILMTAIPEDAKRPAEGVRHPRCYQHFKGDVIQRLDREWTLTQEQVRSWYASWQKERAA